MVQQVTQNQSTFALYYPWVTFQDESWLKLALLTWDGIARIRPPEFGDADIEIVRQVRAETDLILDITPSQSDLRSVSDALEEVVAHSGFRFDWEVPEHLIASELRFYPAPTDGSQGGGTAHVAKDGLVWLYAGPGFRDRSKANDRARGVLGELRLAVPDPKGGPWLGMRPRVASVYLTVLADAVGRHNQLSPVTDDPSAFAAVGALDRMAEQLFGDARQEEIPEVANPDDAYLHLALNAAITPRHLGRLPVSKIIAFRQRYSAELAAFRQHVAALAPELLAVAEVENVQVAQAHLQAVYDKTTKPLLDDLRRALRGLGVESAAGSLGLKVDLGAAAGTVLGAAAAAGGQMAVAGTAVTVAVVPYIAQKVSGARKLRRDSPVAYLLAAERKLGGSSRLPRALRRR